MRDSCKVAVVGGGPAGSSAAIRLRQMGIDTILIGSQTAARGVPVETITPQGKNELRQLGISADQLSEFSVPCFGIESAWGRTAPVIHPFLFEPYGYALCLDSRLLREALSKALSNVGGRVLPGWCVSVTRKRVWTISYIHEHTEHRIDCEFLIDASGRTAIMGRMIGARLMRPDSQVAFMAILNGRSRAQTLGVESMSCGWWYCSPAPSQGVLTCFITDADIARQLRLSETNSWLSLLRQTELIGTYVDDREAKSSMIAMSCVSQVLSPMSGPGWLCAGDSAATFDPLSSVGVVKALIEGRRAAEAAVASLNGASDATTNYGVKGLAEYSRYTEARQRNYLFENRWPNHLFWSRRTVSEKMPPPLSDRNCATQFAQTR